MCHLIFLKSFSLLFPGEAVNVDWFTVRRIILWSSCSSSYQWVSSKSIFPSFPPHGPAGLQGKPMWGAGGRCSNKPPSFNPAKGMFSVLPLLLSTAITNTHVQEDVLFLWSFRRWEFSYWLDGLCLWFTGWNYSGPITDCKMPQIEQYQDWSYPVCFGLTMGSVSTAVLVGILKSKASSCGWWSLVSKLQGVKEKAFVPRSCSMALFGLNFSHVFVIDLYF